MTIWGHCHTNCLCFVDGKCSNDDNADCQHFIQGSICNDQDECVCENGDSVMYAGSQYCPGVPIGSETSCSAAEECQGKIRFYYRRQ